MIYTALILCIHFIETNMIKYPPISHVNLVRDDLIITPHISKHLYPYKYNAKDCIRTNACIY